MRSHFCLECGTQMVLQLIEGREREQCPRCGWIHYLHVKLSAAVLIEEQGQLLLLQRAYQPWKGSWNLPAGYVEVDETPEQAAVREAGEETGLEIEVERLLRNVFFDDDPRGNGLLVVFSGKAVGGRLTGSAESMAYGYFPPEALPNPLCGAGHTQVIQAWQRGEFR